MSTIHPNATVYLDNGERILAGTIVTTIGNGPTELVKASSLELKWGKIQTDEFLRVKGFENTEENC